MAAMARNPGRRHAVLCAAILWLAAPAMALAGERLSNDQIAKALSGVTLDGVYDSGAFFSETYNDDNSIRYHDVSGADSGEWSVKGGKFCTFYESQDGACFYVEQDGANCFTFFEPEETGGETAPPKKDWTSRGWNREHPSTCPTVPEVAL
jgi:hypothetical protein